jgi:hypothetical protein
VFISPTSPAEFLIHFLGHEMIELQIERDRLLSMNDIQMLVVTANKSSIVRKASVVGGLRKSIMLLLAVHQQYEARPPRRL